MSITREEALSIVLEALAKHDARRNDAPAFWTVSQVAERLGVSPTTVRRTIRRDRRGLVAHATVMAALAARRR